MPSNGWKSLPKRILIGIINFVMTVLIPIYGGSVICFFALQDIYRCSRDRQNFVDKMTGKVWFWD